MKIKIVQRGRYTIYQLYTDEGIKINAASSKFLKYLASKTTVDQLPDQKLRVICRYHIKKMEETRI